jgi:hypothetical protein
MITRAKARRSARPHLRAARHFLSLQNRSDPLTSNPLVSMFTQDVPLAVMPFSFQETEYDATIVGENSEVRRAVRLLQSVERHSSYKEKELVTGTIREIAQALAWYGLAPYEIWTNEEGRTGDSPKPEFSEVEDLEDIDDDIDGDVGLSWFTPKRLFCFPRFCVQLVPMGDRKRLQKSLIILPRRIVWLLTMPPELGGYRGYKKLLKRLARFNWTSPPFWREDLEHGRDVRKSTFSFIDYRREIEIYQNRVTREWGWNGRDTTTEKRTEFALFYRLITLRWAQALLREHIQRELNSLFQRLNIQAQIQISGLPTSEEILGLRTAMMEGKISYIKAFERAKL